METEQKVTELIARFDAMTPDSQEKILQICQILKAGEAAATHTTNGTTGHQDTCAPSVDNFSDIDDLFVKLADEDEAKPTLAELGLTLRYNTLELLFDLYNERTLSEDLNPKKKALYNHLDTLPRRTMLDIDTLAGNWAYQMFEAGAALALQMVSDPLILLEKSTWEWQEHAKEQARQYTDAK